MPVHAGGLLVDLALAAVPGCDPAYWFNESIPSICVLAELLELVGQAEKNAVADRR
jgi:hypothetical protein